MVPGLLSGATFLNASSLAPLSSSSISLADMYCRIWQNSVSYMFLKRKGFKSNTILQCPIKKNSQIHQYKVLQRPNNICYVFEKQGHIVSFTNPLASSQANTLSRVTHTVLYIVLFHFTFYQTSINKYFINEDISGK